MISISMRKRNVIKLCTHEYQRPHEAISQPPDIVNHMYLRQKLFDSEMLR